MATDVLRADTPNTEPVVDETAASTAAAAAPVLSKRAAKKSKKQLTAEAEAEAAAAAEERNIAASIDHPYLSFMHKRIRLYKKKLEKIKALEAAQQSDGKKLNDQQQELVASRGLVEKMITEFESLRGQFIEVFVAEQKEKEMEMEATATVEVANIGESSPLLATVDANTNIHTTEDADKLAGDAFDHVKDLLRTLHAVALHQALGTEVPLVLDYFSKVLLGKTRLPAEVPFEENLAESLEEAKRYLTQSDKIVVQEFTYKDLRTMVEKLGVEPAKEEEVVVAVVTEEVAVPTTAAEALPEINFFTDSVIETEAVVEDEPVTEDKVNAHELVAESIEATAVVVAPLPLEVPEPPPVSAVPAPPKSFAAAAATKPAKASNRKTSGRPNPATVVDGEAPKPTEDKPRRRPSSRPKNGSNSPRKDKEGKTVDGSKPDASKPRRPRPQRQNDENHPSQNVKRTSSTGAKGEDRRPRPERQPRKPQETATA